MIARDKIPRRLRRGAAAAAAVAAGVVIVGFFAVSATAGHRPPPAAPSLDVPADPTVLIFVSGAVANPGLYRLSVDARIADAIAAAGGITSAADRGRLPNLAAKLHDGHQVNVPFARSTVRGSATAGATAKLDVNSAGLTELRAVPGMPAGLPEAIVEYRTRVGPFASLTDLREALGVDRTLMTLLGRHLTCVIP